MVAEPVQVADVLLWGKNIAAVAWDSQRQLASFEYRPEFLSSGIQPSPIQMPLAKKIYEFPALNFQTFHGLPGMLADCLPDKYGNALIDAWLARQGRTADSFTPLERLCYLGQRAMGALEFRPSLRRGRQNSAKIQIDEMVSLASEILTQRESLIASIDSDKDKQQVFEDILRVGTSAGGARAKAIVAWNQATNEIRSGQVKAPPGFSYWILKFDGVTNNKDKELADPKGYGRVEYAYYLMAKAAGITMMESRLLEENNRAHFMTKRFDRFDNGDKLHVQSLCAINHLDFNMAGAHSYEQAFQVMRQLDLSRDDFVEQFRRMVFNVCARNQDDHTKNIAYVMNKKGQWRLSPAFDVCFAYNPQGEWTCRHQMSINGKRENIAMDDFLAVARAAGIHVRLAKQVIGDVVNAVSGWRQFANRASVDATFTKHIESNLIGF